MARKNVVLITCHDLGDFLGCYGTPVDTPNLDRMAAEGVLFENHFSTGTVCSPSRGSLMTGCYPHTHGLMGLVHRGWELDADKCPPLPRLLADAGYETHLFGFQHEHWDPHRLGYQKSHQHGRGREHCELVTPLVTDWLEKRRDADGPFLASVGFWEVHRIMDSPSHFKRHTYRPADTQSVEVRPYMQDLPGVREDLADFYGSIRLADEMVGRIFDSLRKSGLDRDTVVIFTTDHGASFMHSKATVYDGGTKVALLMWAPGVLPSGRGVDGLTSHVDVLPTLMDFLGLPSPPGVQGVSMLHAALGRPGQVRDYVFSEKNVTNYYDPTRAIRSRSHKYIRKGLQTCIFDFLIPEIEALPVGFRDKAVFDFYSSRRCREEFYDLRSDPGEMRNLMDRGEQANVLKEMKLALDHHLEESDDPFRNLRNDILLPEDVYAKVRGASELRS